MNYCGPKNNFYLASAVCTVHCERPHFCSKRAWLRAWHTLLTARGFAYHARTLIFFCVLPSVFPCGFSSKKGDCSQSMFMAQLLVGPSKQLKQIFHMLRIPTGRRQISWLFTSVDEDMNPGYRGTNPSSGQSGIRTRDSWIASPTRWPLEKCRNH